MKLIPITSLALVLCLYCLSPSFADPIKGRSVLLEPFEQKVVDTESEYSVPEEISAPVVSTSEYEHKQYKNEGNYLAVNKIGSIPSTSSVSNWGSVSSVEAPVVPAVSTAQIKPQRQGFSYWQKKVHEQQQNKQTVPYGTRIVPANQVFYTPKVQKKVTTVHSESVVPAKVEAVEHVSTSVEHSPAKFVSQPVNVPSVISRSDVEDKVESHVTNEHSTYELKEYKAPRVIKAQVVPTTHKQVIQYQTQKQNYVPLSGVQQVSLQPAVVSHQVIPSYYGQKQYTYKISHQPQQVKPVVQSQYSVHSTSPIYYGQSKQGQYQHQIIPTQSVVQVPFLSNPYYYQPQAVAQKANVATVEKIQGHSVVQPVVYGVVDSSKPYQQNQNQYVYKVVQAIPVGQSIQQTQPQQYVHQPAVQYVPVTYNTPSVHQQGVHQYYSVPVQDNVLSVRSEVVPKPLTTVTIEEMPYSVQQEEHKLGKLVQEEKADVKEESVKEESNSEDSIEAKADNEVHDKSTVTQIESGDKVTSAVNDVSTVESGVYNSADVVDVASVHKEPVPVVHSVDHSQVEYSVGKQTSVVDDSRANEEVSAKLVHQGGVKGKSPWAAQEKIEQVYLTEEDDLTEPLALNIDSSK